MSEVLHAACLGASAKKGKGQLPISVTELDQHALARLIAGGFWNGLMDFPRRQNAMAIQQRATRPPWRNHGVSAVAEPSYEWWAPARPKPGDSQEQVRLRLASANALNQIPRDPRYYEPIKEANWSVNTSLNGHFITSSRSLNTFAVPRIAGIDTYSRPPLVVHSTDALRRTAWIGTRG